MYQLLFIDDDRNLQRVNRDYFTANSFEVFTAENRREAMALLQSQLIDCIILDIMLPGTDGYALCREIKSLTEVPVIFLTSLLDDSSLYQGFAEGGDDFLTKPFKPKELKLRIIARINEHKGVSRRNSLLSFGDLSIDSTGRRALFNGAPLPLTSNEFDILLLMARSPGKPFSPSAIYREIWKLPDLETVNTVRVHVSRLRQKLEQICPDRLYIRTLWGKGYYFDDQKEEAR